MTDHHHHESETRTCGCCHRETKLWAIARRGFSFIIICFLCAALLSHQEPHTHSETHGFAGWGARAAVSATATDSASAQTWISLPNSG